MPVHLAVHRQDQLLGVAWLEFRPPWSGGLQRRRTMLRARARQMKRGRGSAHSIASCLAASRTNLSHRARPRPGVLDALPAVETRPRFNRAVSTDGLIGRMLRPCGTRMVGQDAQACAEWKPLLDLVVWCAGSGDDAVLLICAAHHILAQHLSVFETDVLLAVFAPAAPRSSDRM